MLLPPLHVQEDLLRHHSICFVGHSIVDDLRLLLEESGSELHKDFNLSTVIPVWKAVRGLNFSKFLEECLPFLDGRRCDVIVWQMAGNDLDSTTSVSALTMKYLT